MTREKSRTTASELKELLGKDKEFLRPLIEEVGKSIGVQERVLLPDVDHTGGET
jgi:hypothetical protein